MKDNRTNKICDKCFSHIIVYRSKGKIVYECSYCGEQPEDIQPIDFDLGEEDE